MREVIVIHLPRLAHRKHDFLGTNNIPNLSFKFLSGVDGSTLDFNALVDQNLIVRGTQYYSRGSVGCALSHRNAWIETLALNRPQLICEDDAILRKDFVQQLEACESALPNDWDFLLLGYNFDSILKIEIIPGVESFQGDFHNTYLDIACLTRFQDMCAPISVLPLTNAFGKPGYALSPKGAQRLLQHCFPLRNLIVNIPALRRTMASFCQDCLLNYPRSAQ